MTHILVVDDNPDMISLLRVILERSGYEMIAGSNGSEGIRLLEQNGQLDAIISNYLMPRMDGLAFLETVRASQTWRHIPFVMITALNDMQPKALARGASAFVHKPFKVQDIQQTLMQLGVMPR